jgi:Fe-S-cluster containining protein
VPLVVAPDWRRYLKFRCTGCGNCCRDTIVCLTDADVRRISEGTGQSPLAFVRFYGHDGIAMSDNDPSWVRLGKEKRVMALKTKDNHCIFLEHSSNRCTIYEHRPVTCRDHPFNVTFSPTKAIEKISLSRIVKCPHEWDGNVRRRELRRINDWNERQQETYVSKIKAWNRISTGHKTGREFLRFLGFEV